MSEWVKLKIPDFATIVSGATPATNVSEYWDGEIVWITPNDLSKLRSKFIDTSERKISHQGFKSASITITPARSVVMSSRAPIGYFGIPTEDFTTNQGCKSFVFSDEHDAEFHYYNFVYHADLFKRYGSGSTFMEISKSNIEKLSFLVPVDVRVQRKIAKILSTVDEVIEKTKAAIDKYQAIKAGMMRDLFTRGIDTQTGRLRPTIEDAPELYKESELGWIPKEWEVVPIGDFAKIKGGKRMPAGKEFSDTLTPYPYLRVTDMQNGAIDQSDLKYVPVEIEPLISSYKISVDDVYVTIAGTLGLFGTIPVNLDQAQLTENAAKITEFDKIEYNRDFIKHQCNSMIVQGQVIREIGVGGGVPKLALYRIAQFLFLKPSINEQQTIVEKVQVIENKLNEESRFLNKYKQIKQGLMTDLLNGLVRIKNDIR
jgi:type I restriction enzyme S subunit